MTNIYQTYSVPFSEAREYGKVIKVDENFENAIVLSNEVIGRVAYNTKLDSYNDNRGEHKGITRRKDGTCVIIVGSDWSDQPDYAYEVSEEEALQEILDSGNEHLLTEKMFSGLRSSIKINRLKSLFKA